MVLPGPAPLSGKGLPQGPGTRYQTTADELHA